MMKYSSDGLPESKEYLECGLPTYLKESKEKFIIGKQKHKTGGYFLFDGDYCEFQSDINIAEINGEITSEQAWYLREKYLGITKEV